MARKLVGVLETENKIFGTIGTSGMPGPRGEKGERGERGEKGERGEPGLPGGVVSFNSRIGEVLPQTGDYSSGMVNAVDLDSYITNQEIENMFR